MLGIPRMNKSSQLRRPEFIDYVLDDMIYCKRKSTVVSKTSLAVRWREKCHNISEKIPEYDILVPPRAMRSILH